MGEAAACTVFSCQGLSADQHYSARLLTQSSALAIAAVLALSAYGADSAADEEPQKTAPSQEKGESLEGGEAAEESTEESSEEAEDESTDAAAGDNEGAEVKVVPGKDYGGTISASDFYLDSAGEEADQASSADDELEEAGYEYFERAPRREGKHTGYIPIYVSETADELKGSYVRPEAKVLGDDKKIPEFKSEFEVPAA